MTLVVLAFDSSSKAPAQKLANELACRFIDVDFLYGIESSVLGPEYAFCAASEVAIAAAAGRVVVAGSVEVFMERHKGKSSSLIIAKKLKKMLCSSALDIVVLLPEGTDVPECVSADMRVIRHSNNLVDDAYAKTFAHALPEPILKRFLACNQLRVIYLDADTKARHETVLFDVAAQTILLDKLPPLDSSTEGIKVVVPQENGCSLICLPPRTTRTIDEDARYGQHITLSAGRTQAGNARMPAKMRMVAKSIENDEAICVISENDAIDLSACTREHVRVRPIAWALDVFA